MHQSSASDGIGLGVGLGRTGGGGGLGEERGIHLGRLRAGDCEPVVGDCEGDAGHPESAGVGFVSPDLVGEVVTVKECGNLLVSQAG